MKLLLNQQPNKTPKNKNPLNLALKKLSARTYTQKEIETYLAKYGFNREQIKNVLDQLLSWGYLDDKKLARDCYTYYTQNKPHGYLYIYKKLQEKGVPEHLITSVLDEYDEKKELELARDLAEKYLKYQAEQKSPELIKNMLARHLYRKGFSKTNIMTILYEKFSS